MKPVDIRVSKSQSSARTDLRIPGLPGLLSLVRKSFTYLPASLKPASTTRNPCGRTLELDELGELLELDDPPLELDPLLLDGELLELEKPPELELDSPGLEELDEPIPLLLLEPPLELDEALLELDELLSDGLELEELPLELLDE